MLLGALLTRAAPPTAAVLIGNMGRGDRLGQLVVDRLQRPVNRRAQRGGAVPAVTPPINNVRQPALRKYTVRKFMLKIF